MKISWASGSRNVKSRYARGVISWEVNQRAGSSVNGGASCRVVEQRDLVVLVHNPLKVML